LLYALIRGKKKGAGSGGEESIQFFTGHAKPETSGIGGENTKQYLKGKGVGYRPRETGGRGKVKKRGRG